MQCRACGLEVSDDSTFCNSCGTKVVIPDALVPEKNASKKAMTLVSVLVIFIGIVFVIVISKSGSNKSGNETTHSSFITPTDSSYFITPTDSYYLASNGGQYFLTAGLSKLSIEGVGAGSSSNFKDMTDSIYAGLQHGLNPPGPITLAEVENSEAPGLSLYIIGQNLFNDSGAFQAFEDELKADAAADEAVGKSTSDY